MRVVAGRRRTRYHQNTVIFAVSLGFGVLSTASPDFFAAFPDWATVILRSGIVTASALLLNVFSNAPAGGKGTGADRVREDVPDRESESAAVGEGTEPADVAGRRAGTTASDG